MSVSQLQRMDEIEIWRQKAFVLSRTDRLGRLITKTFDLILTVVRDGPDAEILVYEAESLKIEQGNEMKFDSNRDDIYRALFYGLSASLGSMIETIQERKEKPSESIEDPIEELNQMAQEQRQDDNSNNAEDNGQDHQNFLSGTAKVELEPIESQDDLILDDVDLGDLEDLKYEAPTEEYVIDNILVDSTSEEIDEIMESINAIDNADGAAEEENCESKERDEIDEPTLKRARSSISQENKGAIGSKSAAAINVTPKAQGQLECDNCERTFDSPKSLHKHSRIHNGYKCGDCGNVVKSRIKLLQHYAESHPGKKAKEADSHRSLACSQCDYKAHCPANLTVHMHTHTGEKPFACSECPKKFAQTSNLNAHVRSCHEGKNTKT